MNYLNKNFKDSQLNKVIKPLYEQKQKINNNSKYSIEEKKLIMKGIDIAINVIRRECNDLLTK